jgi:putative copper export protein
MRAEMMSRKPVWEVVPILPMIVLKTHIGNVWIKKMATLVLLLFFLLLINIRTWKGLRFLIVGGIAALCLTSAQSGHAADKGDYSFMILADWVHLSAIACWIGSLFPLRLFLPALLKKIGSKDQLTLKCEIVNRFSTMALWSVLALSASGIYAACIHIPTFEALFSTAYGAVLLFKITFFFLLILLGAFARFYIRPSFRKLTGQPIGESSPLNLFNNLLGRLAGGKEEALKRRIQLRFNSETMATLHLNLIVAIQCLIAVIVIGISAMLTQTSPPPLKPSNEMPAMHDMKHM